MLGSDPASHRREQTARAKARLVVQQAKAKLQANARLPKLLCQRLPGSAELLRDHHGSTVPTVVEQLLMGGRDYDEPDAEGWRQKRKGNNVGAEVRTEETKTAGPSCTITMSYLSSKAGELMWRASAEPGFGPTGSPKLAAQAAESTSAMTPSKRASTQEQSSQALQGKTRPVSEEEC